LAHEHNKPDATDGARRSLPEAPSGSAEARADREDTPETRELDGIIWQLGRISPGSDKIDWQESRRRCAEILEDLRNECPKSKHLGALVAGVEYFVAGDEHHILKLPHDPGRVYKITHGDNLGCCSYFSPCDPELTGRHFHGTGNADPFFYFRRWRILNAVGVKTRFEGFLPPQVPGQLPRFCVCQPVFRGGNPTKKEIRAAFEAIGYYEISEDAFLNFELGLLLTDAAPRNIRILDGEIIPFDAIAQDASHRVWTWILKSEDPKIQSLLPF